MPSSVQYFTAGRKTSPTPSRLTPEPPLEKDEGISEEEDPAELRILLELNEQVSSQQFTASVAFNGVWFSVLCMKHTLYENVLIKYSLLYTTGVAVTKWAECYL